MQQGRLPLILVAPHGGTRNVLTRSWQLGTLRVNDLHTADFTIALAAATGAAALINRELDRNVVDLNSITAAHDGAPGFLAALADLVEEAVRLHGRATVLTIHGWNIVEPAVDIGIGTSTTLAASAAAARPTVSASFATDVVAALVDDCTRNGIAATVGARYPARARENLIQLFTARHAADTRPLVRRLVALHERVDALQLELAIPLRFPGRWRERMLATLTRLAALLVAPHEHRPTPPRPAAPSDRPSRHRIEFVSGPVAGLLQLGPEGGRVLLIPDDGNLLLFTAETARARRDARLTWIVDSDGTLRIQHTGPLLRFADTSPFTALERGLASATVVDAEFEFAISPTTRGGGFCAVLGSAVLGGQRVAVRGSGFVREPRPASRAPHLELAVTLSTERGLLARIAECGAGPQAEIVSRGNRVPLEAVQVHQTATDNPLDRVTITARQPNGDAFEVTARGLHRIPISRVGADGGVLHTLLATVRLDSGTAPAGWATAATLTAGSPEPDGYSPP